MTELSNRAADECDNNALRFDSPFTKLRFDLPITRHRIAGLVKLCAELKNGPLPLSAFQIDAVVGHGRESRVLRQVLVKVKGSNRQTPALYRLDRAAMNELLDAYGRYIRLERTLAEQVLQGRIRLVQQELRYA